MREANGNGSATPDGVGWFDLWARFRGSRRLDRPATFCQPFGLIQPASQRGQASTSILEVSLPQGDPGKLELASACARKPPLVKQIAQRLHLGTPGSASACLLGRVKKGQFSQSHPDLLGNLKMCP